MALTGPDCTLAQFYNIEYYGPGGALFWTGWGPIADIDGAIQSASNVGPIKQILINNPSDASGGTLSLNCCPSGFSYSTFANACIPAPAAPPPAPTPPAPPTPTCPPGYTYDPETNSCIAGVVGVGIPIPVQGGGGGGGGGTVTVGGGTPPTNLQPVPPPPVITPPPTPPSGPPTAPPTGIQDELGTCCTNITAALSAMTTALQSLAPDDPNCCSDTITQINAIAVQLQSIAAIMANPPPPPASETIDFTPLVSALASIQAAVQAIPPDNDANTATLQTAITGIANAITAIPPINLQGLIDAVSSLFTTIDTPQAVYDQLVTDGFLDATDAQLLTPGATGPGGIVGTFKHLWNHAEKLLGTIGSDIEGVASSVGGYALSEGSWLANLIAGWIGTEENAVQATLTSLIAALQKTLTPPAAVSPGNIGIAPSAPLAQVTTWDLNLRVLSALLNFLSEGFGEGVFKIAERLMELIGAAEIAEVELGPLIRFGISRIAEQQAKNTYRQEIPGNGELAHWVARGLFDQATAQTYMGLNGLDASFQTPTLTGAYRGLGTRLMFRAFESGLLTPDVIASELNFMGMRPQSQALLQQLAPYVSTSGPRNQLIAAYEAAYVEGLYADADFKSLVAGAQQITDLPTLQLTRVQVLALTKQTKELVSSYITQFEATIIDQPTLQNSIEAIGIQPNWAIAIVAQAAARLTARGERQAIAAQQKLINQTAAIARKAALQNLKSGTIDLAGYTAALLATGLTAVEAAGWADYASLLLAGNLQWVYGLSLPRAQATILKSQVDAYLSQLGSGLITTAQAVPALQALGLSPTWINALVAKVAASATTKTLAALYPVLPS